MVWSSGALQGHHMTPGWSFKVLLRCLGGFQSRFKILLWCLGGFQGHWVASGWAKKPSWWASKSLDGVLVGCKGLVWHLGFKVVPWYWVKVSRSLYGFQVGFKVIMWHLGGLQGHSMTLGWVSTSLREPHATHDSLSRSMVSCWTSPSPTTTRSRCPSVASTASSPLMWASLSLLTGTAMPVSSSPTPTLALSAASVATPMGIPTMTLSPVMATMLTMRPTWATAGRSAMSLGAHLGAARAARCAATPKNVPTVGTSTVGCWGRNGGPLPPATTSLTPPLTWMTASLTPACTRGTRTPCARPLAPMLLRARARALPCGHGARPPSAVRGDLGGLGEYREILEGREGHRGWARSFGLSMEDFGVSGRGKGGWGCLWGLWGVHGRSEVFPGVFGSPWGALGCQWGFWGLHREFWGVHGGFGVCTRRFEAWMGGFRGSDKGVLVCPWGVWEFGVCMGSFGASMGIWGAHEGFEGLQGVFLCP